MDIFSSKSEVCWPDQELSKLALPDMIPCTWCSRRCRRSRSATSAPGSTRSCCWKKNELNVNNLGDHDHHFFSPYPRRTFIRDLLTDGAARMIIFVNNCYPTTLNRSVIRERERWQDSLSWFEPTSVELHQTRTFVGRSTDRATMSQPSWLLKRRMFVGSNIGNQKVWGWFEIFESCL